MICHLQPVSNKTSIQFLILKKELLSQTISVIHSRKQEARVIGFLGLTSSIERLTHIALSMWKLIGLLDTQIILKVTKICLHVIFGNGIG